MKLHSILGRLCQIASLPLVLAFFLIGWFAYSHREKASTVRLPPESLDNEARQDAYLAYMRGETENYE